MSDSNLLLKRIGTYELSGVRLGKGNFAYVELATNRITQTKVAIKIIDIRKIKDDYVKKNILREASILKKVHHPNIVRLYETLKQRSLYCLVTEYVDGGELLSHLRAQRDCRFSESQARPIVRQMVSALYHLHDQGIVHRDLKMENVLLDHSKQQIKIIDFGLSNACSQNEFLKTQCGSPEYAAPELFKKGCRYGTEVDIWSLGVNIFGMVVGRLPFRTTHCGGRGHSELVDQMNRGLYAVQGRHMIHLTPECKDLLLRLLEPNPQQRIALLQIMEHPWVTQNGLCPLVPYSPPQVDDELVERVLDKASALIKIRKQKIRMHVEKDRYDAICSIYNMLLDQEIKNLYGGRFCGDFEFEFEPEASSSDDELYLPRGTIVSCPEYDRFHDHSRKRHQEMPRESGNEVMARDINSKPRYDSEDATVLHQDRNRQQSYRGGHRRCSSANEQRKIETDKNFSDVLTVRGMRVTEPERTFTPRKCESKTRPNSATKSSGRQDPVKQADVTSQSQNQPVFYKGHKPLKTDFEPVKDLQGTRMILSARRSEKKVHGGETAAFADYLEDSCLDDKTIEHGVKVPFDFNVKEAAEKLDGNNVENTPENSVGGVQRLVPEQTVYQVEGTSGTCKHHEPNPSGTELQYAWMAVNKTKASTPKPRPGRTTAGRSTAKQPLGVASARGFHFLQAPPKSHTKAQSAASVVRDTCGDSNCKSTTDKKDNELTREEHTSPDRFSPVYQKYLASNKYQQKRLSIMQTREVFHHEHTFRAKYSVNSPPGRSSNQTGSAFSAEEEFEQHETRHHSETTQRDELNGRESGASKLPQRSKQSPPSVKPGYTRGVVIHTEHRELSLTGSKSSATKEKREPVRGQAMQAEPDGVDQSSAPIPQPNTRSVYNELKGQTQNREVSNASGDLSPRQQDSLQRMKHVELMMLAEKEKQKITKELQDKERIKMIQQYLDDVYPKPDTDQTDSREPCTQRAFKVTRQGRLYSLQPRNEEAALHCQGSSPKVVTKPAPILHYSHQTPNNCNMGSANKIAFKNDGRSSSARDKVRFFNDWNKTMFINYVNSKGELRQPEEDSEQDPSLQMQLNDASYWLQRHFSGVMAKTSTKNAAMDPSQAPVRQQ